MSTQIRPLVRLASYRILGELGRGGMSVVYLAENEALRRKVALKVLDREGSLDSQARSRFLSEARHAASLDHPNVLPIYEVGEADSCLFIAMRYVEGSDLATAIADEGRMEMSRVVTIVSQVAAALDAAHDVGLIHRDVKPQNILMSRGAGSGNEDHVYLCDFGLTKSTASHGTRTASGELVGTVHYLSPEHIANRPVDKRADVYALGCVLFECLAGHKPFERHSDFQVLWAHVQESPPSITRVRPELPGELDDVLRVALAKDPNSRYSSCGQLVDDLAAVLDGASTDSATTTVAGGLIEKNPLSYRAPTQAVPDLYRGEPGRWSKPTGRAVWNLAVGAGAVFLVGASLAFGSGFLVDVREKGQATPEDRVGGVSEDSVPGRSDESASPRVTVVRTVERPTSSGAAVELHPNPLLGGALAGIVDAEGNVVRDLPLPKAGTYVYSQEGHEKICQTHEGATVCPPADHLSSRVIVDLHREEATNGDDIIVFDKRWDDDSSLRARLRYGRKAARIVAVRDSLNYGGFEFATSYNPRPGIRFLDSPLRVGRSWIDRWSGRTSGTHAVEVVGSSRLWVGGRSLRAIELVRTTRLSGRDRGRITVTEWIDPRTGIVVRAAGEMRIIEQFGVYVAVYDNRLTFGPGYG